MVDTAWEDTEDMVDTVTVLDTGAMVTIMARDPLMPNLKLMPKLMPDICMVDMEVMVAMVMAVDTDIAALVTMEDMVDMVLDTEDMAVSGGKHSQVVLPIFLLELSSRKCQLLIICLMSSHPLIRNQCPTFVESRI